MTVSDAPVSQTAEPIVNLEALKSFRRKHRSEKNFYQMVNRMKRDKVFLLNPVDTLSSQHAPFLIIKSPNRTKHFHRISMFLKPFGLSVVHAEDNSLFFSVKCNPNSEKENSDCENQETPTISPKSHSEKLDILLDTLKRMYEHKHARRALLNMALFVCDKISTSLSPIALSPSLVGKNIRMQTFPQSIIEQLLTDIPPEIELDPRIFDDVLYVYKCDHGDNTPLYLWGVHPRAYHFVTSTVCETIRVEPHVSRAFYKISEIVDSAELGLSDSSSVLDLGASPGGWTECLAPLVSRGRVVAVDPGDMAESVLALENVFHIKSKTQLCIDELRELAPPDGYDLCVCDMNCDPDICCDVVVSVSDLLRPNAYIVITMKLMRRGDSWLEKAIGRCLDILGAKFGAFEYHWLFANSYQERTLIARKL
eukprot:141378_1